MSVVKPEWDKLRSDIHPDITIGLPDKKTRIPESAIDSRFGLSISLASLILRRLLPGRAITEADFWLAAILGVSFISSVADRSEST